MGALHLFVGHSATAFETLPILTFGIVRTKIVTILPVIHELSTASVALIALRTNVSSLVRSNEVDMVLDYHLHALPGSSATTMRAIEIPFADNLFLLFSTPDPHPEHSILPN
jgi:hypothetical protein